MALIKDKKLMIITGACSSTGVLAIKQFKNDYNLLLLDTSIKSLRKIKSEFAPHANILAFDITSTVSRSKLNKTLQKFGGFDYLLHFAKRGPQTNDISLIYKVNLIGTIKLFNKLYPHINEHGLVINLSASRAYLTPIPAVVFPLLNDPLRSSFLDEILPHTTDAALAYGWSKFASACFAKSESRKWGLKEASIVNIFPNFIEDTTKINDVTTCRKTIELLQKSEYKETIKVGLLNFIKTLLKGESPQYNGKNIIFESPTSIRYINDI